MTEQISNFGKSQLDGGINDSVTSLDVLSETLFPTSGNFRIRIEDELMLVTGVSGPTFTVTRGIESTVAASHSSGLAVSHVITAGAIAQLIADAIGSSDAPDTQTFDSDGTWTKPASFKYVKIMAQGPGGAGGGTEATGSSQAAAGGGGGGGGFCEKILSPADLASASTLTVTIGQGGSGHNHDDGDDGGDTTVSGTGVTTISANGGNGGNVGNNTAGDSVTGAGIGGTWSGGDWGRRGDFGGRGAVSAGSVTNTGDGGGSYMGGQRQGSASNPGADGTAYGGGGAAAGEGPDGSAHSGGDGADGRVLIITYF